MEGGQMRTTVESLPGGLVHLHNEGGDVWSGALNDAIMALYLGDASADFFAPVAEICESAIKRNRVVTLYVDGEQLNRYEPEFRERWTDWFIKYRKHLNEMHCLTGSVMLRMGLAVVNLAVSGLVRSYSARRDFERSFGRHIELYKKLHDAAGLHGAVRRSRF
jgi:hypothetical protein